TMDKERRGSPCRIHLTANLMTPRMKNKKTISTMPTLRKIAKMPSPMNRAKSLSRRPTYLQTTSTRCGPADISAGPSYVYGPQVGAHDWMRSCLALHNQQKMIVNICGGASIWRGRLWKTVTNHSAHC